ncbi:MAG TPA: helix-turn-helix transcriptional regulator [Actinomycetota bacterium]|jgi:DNA-binding CsgD family transcriptional regulator
MTLTKAQARVVLLAADGLTNEQIAMEVGTKVSTVRSHVWEARRRLRVPNRTSAVAAYLRQLRDAGALEGTASGPPGDGTLDVGRPPRKQTGP